MVRVVSVPSTVTITLPTGSTAVSTVVAATAADGIIQEKGLRCDISLKTTHQRIQRRLCHTEDHDDDDDDDYCYDGNDDTNETTEMTFTIGDVFRKTCKQKEKKKLLI